MVTAHAAPLKSERVRHMGSTKAWQVACSERLESTRVGFNATLPSGVCGMGRRGTGHMMRKPDVPLSNLDLRIFQSALTPLKSVNVHLEDDPDLRTNV